MEIGHFISIAAIETGLLLEYPCVEHDDDGKAILVTKMHHYSLDHVMDMHLKIADIINPFDGEDHESS